jgi:hypothetical protein
MKFFLKLKHWQLVFIWVGGAILFNATINTKIWILAFEFLLFIYVGWIFSIGRIINRIVTKSEEFKLGEDIWLILFLVFIIPIAYVFRNLNTSPQINDTIILLSGGIGFLCFMRMTIITSRRLKQYEIKKILGLYDHYGYFFLIVFMLIGIWFIQPKLNKIIENN